MKRILTLSVGLVIALSSWAQGFVFQFQGRNLADGETVVIAAEEDLFGELSCATNDALTPTEGLVMQVLNGMRLTVSATLQITQNTLNASRMQWCMGGDCTPLVGLASFTKRFSVQGSEQVQFDASDIQSEGLLTATLSVTIGLESHQVNILFVNGDYDAISAPRQTDPQATTCYDLHGRRLQGRPSAGMFILTDGTKVRKVAVK